MVPRTSSKGLQFVTLPAGIVATLFLLGVAWAWRASPARQQSPSWEELAVGAVQALKAGNRDRAYKLCDEATQLASPRRPGDVRLPRSQSLLGEIHYASAKPDLAEQAFQQAIMTCEQTCGSQSPEMLEFLDALANFYYYQNKFDQVEPLYRRIQGITELTLNQAERDVANRARNLAEVQRRLQLFAEAEANFQKCLAVGSKIGDNYKPELIQDMLMVANFYRESGNIEQAEKLAKQALKMAEEEVGSESMDVALGLECLANIYLAANKPELAEPHCERALRITEQLSGREHSDLAPRLALLATALQGQEKYTEAEQHLQRALAVTEQDLGPECPEMTTLLEQYATVLEELGKPAEAEAIVARLATIREQTAHPQPSELSACAGCEAN